MAEAGYDAEHVVTFGLLHASDQEIWQAAVAGNFVIVTKDEDFRRLAAQSGRDPQVVWIRFGNVSNQVLWVRLAKVLDEIVEALQAGERFVEVR